MPDLKLGYAINQWDPARREQQERTFKVMSACGFRAVELTAGSGRWAPLGNPHQIVDVNFGSAARFLEFMRSCGVDRVASWFYDPGRPSIEEDSRGRSPSHAEDHDGIVESLRPFARLLHDLGGSCLVVRPMASYWQEDPVTDDKVKRAADCWNKVGTMAAEFGIQVALHPDFLCAIHSAEDIARILELTDPQSVGLAIDTAELTIAGNDPIVLFEAHAGRVLHFHFKDTHDKDTLGEYKEKGAESRLLGGGGQRRIARWFWEMGAPGGLVDFPKLVRAIQTRKFGGWIVVESDQCVDPAESAMLNAYYVRNVLVKG